MTEEKFKQMIEKIEAMPGWSENSIFIEMHI